MRTIKILYFARFKERLNYSIESLDLPQDVNNVAQLKSLLAKRGDSWAEIFQQESQVRVAINHQLVTDTANISDDDEVAFFPPVSGG